MAAHWNPKCCITSGAIKSCCFPTPIPTAPPSASGTTLRGGQRKWRENPSTSLPYSNSAPRLHRKSEKHSEVGQSRTARHRSVVPLHWLRTGSANYRWSERHVSKVRASSIGDRNNLYPGIGDIRITLRRYRNHSSELSGRPLGDRGESAPQSLCLTIKIQTDIQKFVVAKTLVKDVVFEETYDTTMSTETDSGSTHSGGNASGPSAEG